VIRLIPPLSCTCDEVTGLSAIFSMADIAPECTTFYSGAPCDGKPTCFQIGDPTGGTCSMASATITFTQSC
jgi:hypothetical protein